MYSDNENSYHAEVFPERTRREDSVYFDVMGAPMKDKITTNERRDMYISKTELQMHQNKIYCRRKLRYVISNIKFCSPRENICRYVPSIRN